MPNRANPVRAIGVEEELWEAAKAEAAERGEHVSDEVRRDLRRYVAAGRRRRRLNQLGAEIIAS